jgi:tetratricopeptide (TPR) repeat protein
MKNEAHDSAFECAPQDTFLFHQTKAQLPEAPSPATLDEKQFAKKSKWLKEELPELLVGDALVSEALSKLEKMNRFSALIVEPELSEAEVTESDEDKNVAVEKETLLAVAGLLAGMFGHIGAIWGFVAPGVFGCFLPETDSKQALQLADDIQKELKKANLSPAITGVAAYPMINYQKGDVLVNALKARDHAAFFGSGANVFFDAVSLNISGDKFYQVNDMEQAVAEYQKALLIDPSEVNVHNSLGVCYGLLGRSDEAEAEFDTAMWLDPAEFMAFYNKGMIKLMQNVSDQALKLFLKADKLAKKAKTDAFEVTFHIGKLYLESDQPDKGLEFLRRALRLKSESAAVSACLGQCYLALDQPDEASAAFQKAVKVNPNDADSLSALGDLYLKRDKNLEIALVYCQQSVALLPDNGLLHYRLGQAYERHNQNEDALGAYAKAAKLGYDADAAIKALENQSGPKN